MKLRRGGSSVRATPESLSESRAAAGPAAAGPRCDEVRSVRAAAPSLSDGTRLERGVRVPSGAAKSGGKERTDGVREVGRAELGGGGSAAASPSADGAREGEQVDDARQEVIVDDAQQLRRAAHPAFHDSRARAEQRTRTNRRARRRTSVYRDI